KPRLVVMIDPASDPNYDGVVTQPSVLFTGSTAPGTKVKLDQGADGTFEQRTKADTTGVFHFTIDVSVGITPVHIQVATGGHKASSVTVSVLRLPLVSITTPTPTPPPTPSPLSTEDIAAGVIQGINEFRAANGLSQLTVNPQLHAAAELGARYVVTYG